MLEVGLVGDVHERVPVSFGGDWSEGESSSYPRDSCGEQLFEFAGWRALPVFDEQSVQAQKSRNERRPGFYFCTAFEKAMDGTNRRCRFRKSPDSRAVFLNAK